MPSKKTKHFVFGCALAVATVVDVLGGSLSAGSLVGLAVNWFWLAEDVA